MPTAPEPPGPAEDRALVVTLAVLSGVRSTLVGGAALTFLYLAGALSGQALVICVAVLLVFAVLVAVGVVRLARSAGR